MAITLTRQVLLIGWDSADWQMVNPLLQRGLMPNLYTLMNRGAVGSLHAKAPFLSPALWTSMITGVETIRHGVLSWSEMRADGAGLQPTRRAARSVPAIWDLLENAGIPTSVINFPASHPADPLSGICISNVFADATIPADIKQSVWPPEVRKELNLLRILPSEIDTASLLTFIPRVREIDFRQDARPAILAKILAHTATVHAATTAALAKDNWRFAAVCYMGIGQLSQIFMPYHAPARPVISDRDFELYSDVVNGAYRFHDLMLGRLLELAGPDTVVMLASNHGYHSDHRRPAVPPKTERDIMSWCRAEAMAVLAGPGVRLGGTISRASLLDVAPTLLGLFGLKTTALMHGKVWNQAPVSSSLSEVNPTALPISTDETSVPKDPEPSLEFLKSLGYIEQIDPHAKIAEENLELDRLHILASVWIEAKKPHEAVGILEHISGMRPAMLDYQVSLAQVYLTTGKIEKFRGLAEKLSHIYSNSPTAAAAMGIAETISQNYGKALQWLQKSEALSSNSQPWLFAELGQAYLRLEQWSKAQLMFEKAIAADDQIAEAYAGLSKVQLQRKENQAAAASARRAAELQPADPEIQYQLGLALLATDEYLEARRALECAVEAKPASIEMIKALAQASEKLGDSPHAKALYHRIFTLESRRRIIPGSAYDSVSHNLG